MDNKHVNFFTHSFFILSLKKHINDKDAKTGQTLLFLACKNLDFDLAIKLIENGANVNIEDVANITAFSYIERVNRTKYNTNNQETNNKIKSKLNFYLSLIDKANIKYFTNNIGTYNNIVYITIKFILYVRYLCKINKITNSNNKNKILKLTLDVFNKLINKAGPNILYNNRDTLLSIVCSGGMDSTIEYVGDLELVQILLNNTEIKINYTPLHIKNEEWEHYISHIYLFKKATTEVFRNLQTLASPLPGQAPQGSAISKKNYAVNLVLESALIGKNKKIIELLINNGADLIGDPMLFYYSCKYNSEYFAEIIFNELIKSSNILTETDVLDRFNYHDNFNQNSLIWACLNKMETIAEKLIKYKYNGVNLLLITSPEANNCNALLAACQNNMPKIAKLLIEKINNGSHNDYNKKMNQLTIQ